MLMAARNAMTVAEDGQRWWGLTFTANEPNVTINMIKTGSPDPITLEASTDGGATWTTFVDSSDVVTPITLANARDKVYIRAGSGGNTKITKSTLAYRSFSLSGSVAASGNIMSLLTQNEGSWQSVAMGEYCFCDMFLNCTSLTSAPALPATTLASHCYLNMFLGCTSLTSAPALPATTLAYSCYSYMFNGCTSLTSAPALPATTLAQSCYSNMFRNCTSLTAAPELNATTLAPECYTGMFRDCTSLTAAPELPATTLAQSCYSNMFLGCTSLTSAPALPATTLATRCYEYMFYGCTSLTSVEVAFTNWNTSGDSTHLWLRNVASSGTFTCPSTLDTTRRGLSTVPSGWTVVNPSYWGLAFTAESANTTIGMEKSRTPPSVTLEKSTDGNTWTSFDPDGGSVTLANVGDKVYFRAGASGNTRFASDYYNYYRFTIPNGSAAASGNIMSLLTQNESGWQSVTMANYCFGHLFFDCTGLTSAPALPATTLVWDCYEYMFRGCTSLTSAPVLPATTLAGRCYDFMFGRCTSLTSAPALPATILSGSCYSYMFQGCTSLTSAPVLPATTLASSCYDGMFKDCTSLTSAPVLPTTTLRPGCYANMFNGCTSLTSAPVLPATTLAGRCYEGMFRSCTSLASAPALPATTLAEYCCSSMFQGCTSLTTAPTIPAMTPTDACYYQMFQGCTSLNSVTVEFTSWPVGGTGDWLEGVAASGTFTCPSVLNITRRDSSYVPAGWSVSNPAFWGLTFTAGAANTTIGMAKTGTPPSVTLEKSTDGGNTWTSFDPNGGSVTLANIGDKVCFRAGSSGNIGFANDTSSYYSFTIPNGSAAASGNIMSLLTQNESGWQSVTMASHCFYSLFIGCAGLTSAPALPATNLVAYCYFNMFWGCTSLASAPVLPAATLADNCYFSMFRDCTGLTSAPALPATTLAYSCYRGMFYGCTSLTSAPALPATTLATYCYSSMFWGCTSLTSAPALPATTLATYCYFCMFYGCTSLNSVTVGFTSWLSGATDDWLYGVAASGTFTCPSVLNITRRDSSYVPAGWSVSNPSS